MRQGVFEIYCDESGFTGPELLNPAQPYFTFAAVQVSAPEAAEIVGEVRTRFGISGELKASKLLTFNRGQKAVDFVLDCVVPRTHAVFHEKKCALAGKFYEYVFEPVLPHSFFYDIGFNKFIANLIYLEVLAAPSVTQPWLLDFQQYVRTGDLSHLHGVASGLPASAVASILGDVVAFASLNREAVTDEIEGLRQESGRMNPWVLDVTSSALYEVLRAHGDDLEVLDVTCDDSQAVVAQRSFFDAMIGRTDRPRIKIGQIERSVVFNLNRSIQLAPSGTTPGVQLADVVAGALDYALLNRREERARQWLKLLLPRALQGTVTAELERVHIDHPKTRFHALILRELVSRSERGQALLEDWEPFLAILGHFGELPDYDAIVER